MQVTIPTKITKLYGFKDGIINLPCIVSNGITLNFDNDFYLMWIKSLWYIKSPLILGQVLNLYHQLHSSIRSFYVEAKLKKVVIIFSTY